MSKNLIVTIIVILIALGAGGYYLMNRQPAVPVNPEPAEPVVSPTTTMEKTTLKSFMNMGGNQQCEFSDMETGSSGSVFIADGKMRGDFSANAGGKATASHMINDGKDIYIWMDDQATGFKTSLTAMEEMSNTEGMTGVNQTVDLNKQVDYKCESWSADQLKFAVPVEVKFQDMAAMMKNMPSMASSAPSGSAMQGNAEACKACENLDDQQRTSCRTALKCN